MIPGALNITLSDLTEQPDADLPRELASRERPIITSGDDPAPVDPGSAAPAATASEEPATPAPAPASEEAVRACVEEARRRGVLLHTHSSESRGEIEMERSAEQLQAFMSLAPGDDIAPQSTQGRRNMRAKYVHRADRVQACASHRVAATEEEALEDGNLLERGPIRHPALSNRCRSRSRP